MYIKASDMCESRMILNDQNEPVTMNDLLSSSWPPYTATQTSHYKAESSIHLSHSGPVSAGATSHLLGQLCVLAGQLLRRKADVS